MARRLPQRLASLALGMLVACDFHEGVGWTEQVQASGPCYEANLLDGLDEASTAELHATFACLDQDGAFAPLRSVDQSFDALDPEGEPAGIDLARLVNRGGIVGVLDEAITLVRERRPGIERALRLSAELVLGQAWSRIDQADTPDGGVVRPLLSAMPEVASSARGAGTALLLGDVVASPIFADLILTASALSGDLAVLPGELGEAIERTGSPDNDKWSGASGDSLADLGLSLAGGLETLAPPLENSLADTTLRARVRAELTELSDRGRLRLLPRQLQSMASEDVEGGGLAKGEDSALIALLRLLHRADAPLHCEVDLGITTVEFDRDNLAEGILETLAGWDEDTATGSVELASDVLGWNFSRSTLQFVADSGVCSPIDDQLVADLESIDRLTDDSVGDLLAVLVGLLNAFDDAGRIPEMVDILGGVYEVGAAGPLQEILRDLGDASLLGTLVGLVPELLEPTTDDPFTFEDLWSVLADGVDRRDEWAPPVEAALSSADLAQALDRLAALLQQPESEAAGLIQHLPELVELDPELDALPGLGEAVADPTLHDPALRILATPEVDAALAGEPLPFYAQLVVGGTFTAALDLVDWTLELLDAS